MLSLAEAKKIKGIETLNDEEIISIVEEQEGIIEEYCNTVFRPTPFKEKRDALTRILLRKRPILNINVLKIKEKTCIEDKDFFLYPEKNLVEIPNLFNDLYSLSFSNRCITIEYNFGYVKVPSTVKNALKSLIRLQVEDNSTDSKLGMESESWDDYSYTRTKKTTEKMKDEILASLTRFIQSDSVEDSDGNIRAYLV